MTQYFVDTCLCYKLGIHFIAFIVSMKKLQALPIENFPYGFEPFQTQTSHRQGNLRFRNTAKMAILKMKLCIFADELASLIPYHHK